MAIQNNFVLRCHIWLCQYRFFSSSRMGYFKGILPCSLMLKANVHNFSLSKTFSDAVYKPIQSSLFRLRKHNVTFLKSSTGNSISVKPANTMVLIFQHLFFHFLSLISIKLKFQLDILFCPRVSYRIIQVSIYLPMFGF